jgi:hypothetical protein
LRPSKDRNASQSKHKRKKEKRRKKTFFFEKRKKKNKKEKSYSRLLFKNPSNRLHCVDPSSSKVFGPNQRGFSFLERWSKIAPNANLYLKAEAFQK